MISHLNDPNAELLKSYIPPFKGTWKTLPAHLLPDDVLQDSLNVTLLGGKLRSRLGLKRYDNFNFNSYVLGSFVFVDASNKKSLLASTATKLYRYESTWTDITDSVTLSAASQVRMTSIQQGSSVYLIYTNGVQNLKFIQDTGTLSDITPYSGSIPILLDICTAFDRIVGIYPPYTVMWSDTINSAYLGFSNWPLLNQNVLAQTEDVLVAIRSLGTLNFAVYKEGNIFTGIAQNGPASQAFRFDHRGAYEGPAGVNAIVDVNGMHIYMTPTGRIGTFDGTQQSWICDGLWPFLQDDIDITYRYNVHGCYNYKTAEVYFWYPRIGDNGLCTGMVIIDIPYPLAGIQSYSYFLGRSVFPCMHSTSVRVFNTLTSPLVYSANGSSYLSFTLDKNTYTDDSRAFSCGFSTGLFKPTPQQKIPGQKTDTSDIYRPTLELYTTRDDSRGSLDLSVLTANALETDGNSSVEQTLDLTVVSPNEFIGFQESGSFLGVKAAWDSTSKVEYKGCDVYGRRTT